MELSPASIRALIAHGDRRAVAAACGVDRTTVSRWANGRRTPTLDHVPNIARALQLRVTITPKTQIGDPSRRAYIAATLEVSRHATP